jgi:hypothetical protein
MRKEFCALAQGQTLRDAETVRLIDNRKTQPCKLHRFFDQRVRTDQQVDRASLDGCPNRALVGYKMTKPEFALSHAQRFYRLLEFWKRVTNG